MSSIGTARILVVDDEEHLADGIRESLQEEGYDTAVAHNGVEGLEKALAEKFDLILSGLQSDDQGNSQLGLLLAELLDMSHASLGMGTEMTGDSGIKVKRELESGWFQWTELTLPASISIQSGINTPRYATLKGIMMVKNKTVDELNAEAVGGYSINSKVQLKNLYIPEKSKETTFIDGSPDEISDKLVDIFKNEIKVLN